jgi:uncharacterized protein YjbJ (UPF0337 family)
MKPSTKNQIKGALHKMKGTAKEQAGQATRDPTLVAEGQAEMVAGKVQQKIAQLQRVFEK